MFKKKPPPQHYYYRSPELASSRPQPKHHKRRGRLLLVLLLLVIITSGVIDRLILNEHVKAHELSLEEQAKQKAADTVIMNNTINSVINNNLGITFGVAITDLNTGARLNYGETDAMTAASVGKLLTAAYLLHQVERGKESLNETLEDGNTASYDLKQMIVVSDDNAWQSLNDELGLTQIQNYANQLNLTSYNWQSNSISARDIANLLTSLYEGKLLNSTNTQLLLSYMKIANYQNLILPAVPKTDTVYHKYGEYNDNVNDATIITNGKQTIVLVIFTNGNGTYQWGDRADLMQQMTKPILATYQLN